MNKDNKDFFKKIFEILETCRLYVQLPFPSYLQQYLIHKYLNLENMSFINCGNATIT